MYVKGLFAVNRFRWMSYTLALLLTLLLLQTEALKNTLALTPTLTPSPDAILTRALIPQPTTLKQGGAVFVLKADSAIYVDPANAELAPIAEYLQAILKPSTGFALPVVLASGKATLSQGSILLAITSGAENTDLGAEGYALDVTPDAVTLKANQPAGVFRGVQTIRQLLPAAIERRTKQAEAWRMPSVSLRDYPRFAWRGAMLDVARHFFPVSDIKRYIDVLAYYKINVLHLHLTDDQGWRIEIKSWPQLTTIGSSTAVGGGKGGFYTQADYAEIVAYAQKRYITLVPEIDMPGHTNAALASYPELSCDGNAPKLYTGTEVGFSSLCISSETTYKFIDEVIGELAALTLGPYIHIGGDESKATPPADYVKFVERVQAIVSKHGKQVIGWEEIASARLIPNTIAQHWNADALPKIAVNQGAKILMSPASRAYMDMKYTAVSSLGLDWAGLVEVDKAYTWDPATLVAGVGEKDVIGIEAPLWSETLTTLNDIETMTFPRLLGYAELGWSPSAGRTWAEYRARLATHGMRLAALGAKYYASPLVNWASE